MTISAIHEADLAGLSVLIVEDEFYLAMEMQEEIERAGGLVIGPVAASEEGVDVLQRGGIDCALVDINLGEGPSFTMADALRSAGIPFIFLTGYDGATIPDRFDAIDRLHKPTNIPALLQALKGIRTANPVS